MSASRLLRWGGLALLLGGFLWGVQKVGWQLFIGDQDPLSYPQPAATILWALGLLAALFVLLGLPALYLRQASQAGRLGFMAFAVVFTGMALVTGNAYFGIFFQAGLVELILMVEEAGMTVQEPVAAVVGFLASLALYTLGWLLFALSSLRARVLPRGPVVLLMIGLVAGLLFVSVDFPLPLPLTEIGIALLGFALWQERGEVLLDATAGLQP